MVSFTHHDAGTPESAWRSDWRAERQLDIEALFSGRLPERVVILAAHPDDETLAAAGLLTRLAQLGVAADVVVATNGEASHPGSATHSPERLAAMRRLELNDAVAVLAPQATVHFLDLPDGAVREEAIMGPLRAVLDAGTAERTLLAAPWHRDGHPDHDAAGRAARRLAHERGLPLLEYPIWLWHWAEPDSAEVPWEGLRVLRLESRDLELKRSALLLHASQTAPLSPEEGDEVMLNQAVLEHFNRGFEAFVVTEATGVFERLHAGSEDPWGYVDRFYERRKRAVILALLPQERFGSVLELGCSVGVLSAELAERADSLVALDISPTAVERASVRLNEFEKAEARVGTIPEDWPEDSFDLIVLSETGYYLSPAGLRETVVRTVQSLAAEGVVLLCHWRHPVDGWALDGDAVHAQFLDASGLAVLASHTEEDFRIDVLVRPPAVSVARRTGVL